MGVVRAHVKNGEAERGDHKDDCRPRGEPGEPVGRGTGTEGGLRALSAECAGEVGRAALLDEDDSDEKQAHDDVDGDNEVQENLHVLSCFPTARSVRARNLWCGGGDLNPYAFWAPAPQAGASANFATSALGEPYEYNKISRFGAGRG